jgi:catechol 2,3-dioxygenase-like lactoylglutathione lyase family enzyme
MKKAAIALALSAVLTGVTVVHGQPSEEPIGRITGLGGVFVRSKDPKVLAQWYRQVLGLDVASWGGVIFKDDAPLAPPVTTWNALPLSNAYMAPSGRDVMINFAVDDLGVFLTRLRAKGVAIIKETDGGATGRFAWILDPDGTKIELWEPARKPLHAPG